jgi:hypothetical protein
MEIKRVGPSSGSGALAVLLIVCAGSVFPASGRGSIPTEAPTWCGESQPRLPDTVQIEGHLRAPVQRMLTLSATFRQQCRRAADAPWVRVVVRVNPAIVERSFRARSVIRRSRSGLILALVEIGPLGSPVEWIAHEFEHVLEQLDGLPLRQLAGRTGGVWQSSENVFETERAIRVGRTVADEVRRRRAADGDILVE